jgi:ASC-1-like (ASCH) protein
MRGKRKGLLMVLAFLALILVALCLVSGKRGPAHGGDRSHGEGYEDVEGGRREFQLRLRDPGYTYALKGEKTVEARPNKAPFNALTAGEAFTVARSRPQGDTEEYPGQRRFAAKVSHVKTYPSIGKLLDAEGLKAYAPGAKDKAAATALFREFTDVAAEKENGLVAIAFARQGQ